MEAAIIVASAVGALLAACAYRLRRIGWFGRVRFGSKCCGCDVAFHGDVVSDVGDQKAVEAALADLPAAVDDSPSKRKCQ